MRAQCLVVTGLIISASLLLTTACRKAPLAETLHAAAMNHSSAMVTNSVNRKDLGVLPLSNHNSTTITLGNNYQCSFTPTLMRSGDIEIILSLEKTAANGTLLSMNVARVQARSGEPFDVSIGNLNLAFTPQLTSQ